MEGILSQSKTFASISARIPVRVKNTLVLMTVLPIAHWFINEYIACNLYKDFAVAFPKVRKL